MDEYIKEKAIVMTSRRTHILRGNDATEEPLLRAKPPRSAKANLAELITRNVARLSDHRAGTRYPAPASARSVRVDGRSVLINDISASGLQVDANFGGDIGDRLSVSFPDFPEMEGRIVWIKTSTTGLALPTGAIDLTEID